MTSGSLFLCLVRLLVVVVSVSGQPVSLPNNILQFKGPHEQYQYRQGFQLSIPGGTHYHDPTKLNVLPQSVPHHDFTQKARHTIYTDEMPSSLPSESWIATQNHQPAYPSFHFGPQKDHSTENSEFSNKLTGLANALARHPKPDAAHLFDQIASGSELHQEVCAPPKPPNPPPTPCASQPQQPEPPKPPCLEPAPATTPCPRPKPEVIHAPVPAPKFIPSKNPFSEQKTPDSCNTPFVSVSPLHHSSKHFEASAEAPCAPPPPAPHCSKKECEAETEIKPDLFVIPAERPVVCNPFSNSQRERVLPLPNPKAILHHRLHADEHLEYPEGYASRPETQSKPAHIPYVVTYPRQYLTVGGVGNHMGYPFVPTPVTKPIPLVVPPEHEVQEDGKDEHDVVYRPGKSSRRYNDDKTWSTNVLRDIADKLGAILDEDFRNNRRSSRRYYEADRGYGEDERYEENGYSSRNYDRGNGDYYEQDHDDDQWKERRYRGPSY